MGNKRVTADVMSDTLALPISFLHWCPIPGEISHAVPAAKTEKKPQRVGWLKGNSDVAASSCSVLVSCQMIFAPEMLVY
jgi:hypothetical protein